MDGFKVGVAWQGDPRHSNDKNRSFRLEDLAPWPGSWRRPHLLQPSGPGSEQVATAGVPVIFPNDGHDESWGDTAAIISKLDLVVAPDTAIAHVAGALGKPTWVALPEPAEWRWMVGREDSPWYPGHHRLFRQSSPGDWPACSAAWRRPSPSWSTGRDPGVR